jgi:hypothetical protein
MRERTAQMRQEFNFIVDTAGIRPREQNTFVAGEPFKFRRPRRISRLRG